MPIHKKCGTEYHGKECPVCKSVRAAEYRAANKEAIKASNAAYYAKNPDRYKDNAARWVKENPVKRREICARYDAKPEAKAAAKALYEQNKETIIKRSAAWAKNNPERAAVNYRICAHNRRARLAAVGGRLSPNIAERLFKLQRGKCACCGLPLGDNYHMDHIMPIVLGGSNTDDNIQLLRQRCNNEKHAKHPVSFMQERGFLL